MSDGTCPMPPTACHSSIDVYAKSSGWSFNNSVHSRSEIGAFLVLILCSMAAIRE